MDQSATPKGLLKTIIQRIGLEKALILLRRKITFSGLALTILLVLAVIPSVATWHEAAETGFINFLSLALSDAKNIPNFWLDYFYTILESAPGLILVSFLTLLGVVLVIIRLAISYLDSLSRISNNIGQLLRYKK